MFKANSQNAPKKEQEKTKEGVEERSSEGIEVKVERGKDSSQGEKACLSELEACRSKITELETEIESLKDQYLRKAAEFENTRKRMARDKQDAIDFANQGLLLDLIPIVDDFERAIKSAEDSKNFESFHEGVVLIEKRLISQLETKWNLVRYESSGEPFDPNFHEAIMMEKSSEISEPRVAEDFYKGYRLKDRVVRPAKVRVLMPEEPESPAENQNAGTGEVGQTADQEKDRQGEGSSDKK